MNIRHARPIAVFVAALMLLFPLIAAGQFFGGRKGTSTPGTPIYHDKMSWGLCTQADCSVGTDLTVHYIVPYALHPQKCYVNAKTAPVGADLVIDIWKNAATSIFPPGTGKLILAAGSTNATQTSFAVTSFAEGDLISVNIDQVGSTTAGAGLSVVCKLTL